MATMSSIVLAVALLATGLGATTAQTLAEGLGSTSGGLGLLLSVQLLPCLLYNNQ